MKRLVEPALALTAALALSLGVQERASAQEGPEGALQQQAPSAPIKILAFETKGSGCPLGTAEALPMIGDASSQTLGIKLTAYESYVSESEQVMTMDCQIKLYLQAPKGLRTALNTITYYGYADLDPSVTGRFEASYFWAGRPIVPQSSTPKVIVGKNEPFTWTDKVSATQWSDCESEEELVLQTALRVINGTPAGGGSMKVDRAETEVRSSVSLQFLAQRCNAATPSR